jgi:hypothetical protein
VEFIVVFLLGFFSFWFLTRDDFLPVYFQSKCPKKESVVRMAEVCSSSKLKKEIKEFSLMRIRDGHYEYEEVLSTLMKKDKNDKA